MNNYILSKYADWIKEILNEKRVSLSFKTTIDQNNNISTSAIAEIYNESEGKYNTIISSDMPSLVNDITFLAGFPSRIKIGNEYFYIIENSIGEVSILKVKISETRGDTFIGTITQVINDCSGNDIYKYLHSCNATYTGSIKYLHEIKKDTQ